MASRAGTQRGVVRILLVALILSAVAVVAGISPAAAAESPPVFVAKWGSRGSDDGRFENPGDVAVDGAGNVYVADVLNHRIQKFTATGDFIATWGSPGSGEGQFQYPSGVGVDGDGNVFVADSGNLRIQKFSASGEFITAWGSPGTADGQFQGPQGIAIDGDNNVYVADNGNNRVQKFTSTGEFISSLGSPGSGNGQFGRPIAVAVDDAGNVYVTQVGSRHRVQKFSPTGDFITAWGSFGSGNGQFNFPAGIAVDAVGNVYVVELYNHRVQKFTSTGTFISTWGTRSTANGRFNGPTGLAIGQDGSIYVADNGNNRIQRFAYPPRPDGRIKLAGGTFVGNNIYNITGVGQTQSGSAAPGGTVTYVVQAQNDMPLPDALRLRGTASNAQFTIRYTVGETDITTEMVAGTYVTATLGPGASQRIRVEVTVDAAAPAGASLTGTLITKSNADATRRDFVRFVTSRG